MFDEISKMHTIKITARTHFVGCSEEYKTLWETLGRGPLSSVNHPALFQSWNMTKPSGDNYD